MLYVSESACPGPFRLVTQKNKQKKKQKKPTTTKNKTEQGSVAEIQQPLFLSPTNSKACLQP